jgi:hypothetical protein
MANLRRNCKPFVPATPSLPAAMATPLPPARPAQTRPTLRAEMGEQIDPHLQQADLQSG